jgi:hypothetical protein
MKLAECHKRGSEAARKRGMTHWAWIRGMGMTYHRSADAAERRVRRDQNACVKACGGSAPEGKWGALADVE